VAFFLPGDAKLLFVSEFCFSDPGWPRWSWGPSSYLFWAN